MLTPCCVRCSNGTAGRQADLQKLKQPLAYSLQQTKSSDADFATAAVSIRDIMPQLDVPHSCAMILPPTSLVFLHTTYTCAFKPGCLMSHNWLHTPDCKLKNENEIPVEVPFWLCCTASQQCRSTGFPTACLIAAVLAPRSSGIERRQAWAQSVPRTSLPVPATPGKIST